MKTTNHICVLECFLSGPHNEYISKEFENIFQSLIMESHVEFSDDDLSAVYEDVMWGAGEEVDMEDKVQRKAHDSYLKCQHNYRHYINIYHSCHSHVRPQKYYIRIFGEPKNVAYTMFVHAQKLFGAAIAMHDSTTASIFFN